ncbi:MAG: penicillin acylase family protein [Ignavibacteriaceae bacterium]
MKKWIKISVVSIITLLIVLAAASVIFYNELKSSLPEYTGELSVTGIDNDIKIYFDSLAIPYIFASTETDAAFALGFLHARERIFTMDIIRRAGEGRLSEILGEETLPFDKMFRTIGISRFVNEQIKKVNPVTLKMLQSYSDGVNYYLKNKKDDLPVEFDILGYDPEKWKPEHSLIIIRMMAWELNLSWWSDFTFIELIDKLGTDKMLEIYPDYPENAPLIVPDELMSKFVSSEFRATDKLFRKFFGWNGTHIGSNNWVINSGKSASGKPVIANDPHLAYSAPGKWYAAVVKAGSIDAAGVTLPGVPGIVIGKNQNIAWALTNIMTDDSDFYIEKTDSSGMNYYFNDAWHPLNIITDTIYIKDNEPVEIKIKSTHRGPIISDIHPYKFVYKNKNRSGYALSFRWAGNDFSDEYYSFYLINKAENFEEFRNAVSHFSVPGQNFIYADKLDNIGYVFGGRLPVREGNSPTIIFDGSSDQYDWRGYLPAEKMPSFTNPGSGFIATANNKVLKNFKYHISNIWEPPSRIERIYELIESKQLHTAEDFMKYQMDEYSRYAEKIIPFLLQAFEDVKVTDKNLSVILQLFRKWDFRMDKYQQAPAVYAVFFKYLMKNIYQDEMGEDLFNEFVFIANIPYRSILKILNNPVCSWFDNVNTQKKENRNDIIRQSLTDALTELEEKYGTNPEIWQWGKLHKVKFKHLFSGNSDLIDGVTDIGPFEIGGDGTTIMNGEYTFSESLDEFAFLKHEDFENDLGPSMRFIYDFADSTGFYLALTTGQSGNIFSPHYDDMTPYWLEGRFFEISTDDSVIASGRNSLLKLIKSYD